MEAAALGRNTAVPTRRPALHEASREAFTALVREHDRNMRMLVYRLLGDAGIMDDVLQEAYLKAYRAYASFDHRSAPGTWLYRIVYNCCLDRLRKSQRERRGFGEVASIHVLEEAGVELRGAEDIAARLDGRHDLAAALASLPVEQRAAVLLVDAVGYGYRDAAEVLGTKPGTLASRLNRGRAALRSVLAETPSEEER